MTLLDTDATPQAGAADGDEALRKRLLKRVAAAAAVVVVLLGGLVMFESSVRKERQQQEQARIESATKPIEKPAEEKPEPAPVAEDDKAASKPEEKIADAGAAVKEIEAEPETTEAPKVEAPPKAKARPERPLTVPARPQKAMVRPSEPQATQAPAPAPRVAEVAKPAAIVAAAKASAQPAQGQRPIATVAETVRQFLVQVGVFSNVANAEELRAKIEAAGIPAHIETRVQVGPFASRQEAEQAREKLKSLGIDPGIVVARK